MIGICQMVLWLTGSLLDHFDPQKTEASKLSGDMGGGGGGGGGGEDGLVSEFMWGIVAS